MAESSTPVPRGWRRWVVGLSAVATAATAANFVNTVASPTPGVEFRCTDIVRAGRAGFRCTHASGGQISAHVDLAVVGAPSDSTSHAPPPVVWNAMLTAEPTPEIDTLLVVAGNASRGAWDIAIGGRDSARRQVATFMWPEWKSLVILGPPAASLSLDLEHWTVFRTDGPQDSSEAVHKRTAYLWLSGVLFAFTLMGIIVPLAFPERIVPPAFNAQECMRQLIQSVTVPDANAASEVHAMLERLCIEGAGPHEVIQPPTSGASEFQKRLELYFAALRDLKIRYDRLCSGLAEYEQTLVPKPAPRDHPAGPAAEAK